MNPRCGGAQDVIAHDRIGVQPHLRSTERLEAQVEHLERQAIALRLVVLPDVAAPLEQRQQAMDGRRRLAQARAKLRQAHPARTAAQDFADLERLVDRGH